MLDHVHGNCFSQWASHTYTIFFTFLCSCCKICERLSWAREMRERGNRGKIICIYFNLFFLSFLNWPTLRILHFNRKCIWKSVWYLCCFFCLLCFHVHALFPGYCSYYVTPSVSLDELTDFKKAIKTTWDCFKIMMTWNRPHSSLHMRACRHNNQNPWCGGLKQTHYYALLRRQSYAVVVRPSTLPFHQFLDY